MMLRHVNKAHVKLGIFIITSPCLMANFVVFQWCSLLMVDNFTDKENIPFSEELHDFVTFGLNHFFLNQLHVTFEEWLTITHSCFHLMYSS